MLVLKLFLVPVFLALVSLAGKRWGAGVAGWLAGFPIVAGPTLLFLGIERGAAFTADAAVLSLSAVAGAVAFSLAYAWACQHRGWAASLTWALAAWLACAALLALLPASLWLSFGIALAAVLAAPRLFPRAPPPTAVAALPRQEIAVRMLTGGATTFAVTAISPMIGPTWSGLLAVFPIMTIVLVVFSHLASGPNFVVSLLRALASGLYSFITFCFTLAILLKQHDVLPSFLAATVLALLAQGLVKLALTRQAARSTE